MLLVLFLLFLSSCLDKGSSEHDTSTPCSIHAINGLCLSQIDFMKEHCPDYCEDFSSSKYKCADHPDIDCEAVKASGLCDDLSKSMFIDNKCPVTCAKCPEHVLGVGAPVTTLHFESSSFSVHKYPELDEAALRAIENTHKEDVFESQKVSGIQGESVSSSEASENSDNDDLKRSDETINSAHGQSSKTLESVGVTVEGDIAIRTCADIHESCSVRATHGECDLYPKWMHQNCAKSCDDCDGKKSEAVLARTAHLLVDADGSGCVDLYPDCVERTLAGDCTRFDSAFMFKGCRRSCRKCSPAVPDPEVESLHEQLQRRQQQYEEYQRQVKASEAQTTHKPPLPEVADTIDCKDAAANCADLASYHGCNNPEHSRYMYVNCAKTCNTCEYLDSKKRCTRAFLNISDSPAFGPGEMSQMFRNLKTRFGHRFNITYLSTSPWVVSIDNFISDAEIDAMRAGVSKWYDIQGEEYSREHDRVVGEGRSGKIGWCFGDCDRASMPVLERMKELTSIPINNIENFQMLEYSRPFDQYIVHHDYNYQDVPTPTGNRVLTFFMYLSDVEEGGETEFPTLGIKVKPKKGRAAMWVNALDSDPFKKDIRTDHQGNPPLNGIKYGANAGIHIYDFRTSMQWHCNWGGDKPDK